MEKSFARGLVSAVASLLLGEAKSQARASRSHEKAAAEQ
jgi:hypothetical protein